MNRPDTGFVLGPVFFLVLLLIPLPDSVPPEAMRVAAITALMATWWITEAIPIPATSLLPIVLFPLMGVMDGSKVTIAYGNHLVFLFMGGFFIAVTVEKWNLHRRIALHTIRLVGVTPERIILGMMLATAFLSMWISNLAATMMMMTIGMAVLQQSTDQLEKFAMKIDTRKGHYKFGIAMMLGIAYAASIGGISTLVGTAPNALFAGIVEQQYGTTISMVSWMMFAFPLAVLMLFITWFYLTRIIYPCEIDHLPGGYEMIHAQIKELGPVSTAEIRVSIILVMVAGLWIFNGLLDISALRLVKDSTIAIFGALLLFVIPANFKKREFLLDWQTAVGIPWDILILFGGGFALALGFSESGLTHVIAGQLALLKGATIVVIIVVVTTMVIFLTEVTSNTATASIMLPIMLALAEAMQVHPYGIMLAAVIAASFAFMLPVATPPNAIIFGSRYVTMPQMVIAGFWLNIIGILLISIFVLLLLPIVWNIDISVFPNELK